MGLLALAALSAEERRGWIEKGLDALGKGAVAHNHFFFHSDAIDCFLLERDWPAARQHAELLRQYTAEEPLGWPDFVIARARWAAEIGESGFISDPAALDRFCATAAGKGFRRSLSILGLDRVSGEKADVV